MYPSELNAILRVLAEQKKEESKAEAAEVVREQRNLAALMSVVVNSSLNLAGMFAKRKPKMTKPEDFLSKDFQKIVDEIFNEARDERVSLSDRASQIADAKNKGLKGPW